MLAPALLLAFSPGAHALELTVALDPAAARQAGVDAGEAEARIASASSATLNLEDPQRFLDQMATANAFATSGMGVDYASNPQRFYAGGSVGTASSGGGLSIAQASSPLDGPGFAFQASAVVGVNLGMLAEDGSFWRRVVVSANGVVARDDREGVTARMENWGAHAQVKVVTPAGEGVVQWGGLDLTTGYEVASYHLLIAQDVPVSAEDLRWDATGTLDLGATSRTLPFEVSTNARFAFLTGYVGAAIDARLDASADGEASLDGPLVATARGEDVSIGTVAARLGLAGSSTRVAPRLFAGLQINATVVKIYGHFNLAPDDTYAGHVGARIAL